VTTIAQLQAGACDSAFGIAAQLALGHRDYLTLAAMIRAQFRDSVLVVSTSWS
jgi:hypothetical protein